MFICWIICMLIGIAILVNWIVVLVGYGLVIRHISIVYSKINSLIILLRFLFYKFYKLRMNLICYWYQYDWLCRLKHHGEVFQKKKYQCRHPQLLRKIMILGEKIVHNLFYQIFHQILVSEFEFWITILIFEIKYEERMC